MPADYHANGLVTSRSGSINKVRSPSARNAPSTSDNEDQSSSAYSSLNRQKLRPPAYAFILPNLEKFPQDFRRFIENDIIELGTLRRLENSGHLNWWCGQNYSNQRLWPLTTQGDGNCLLHAASLGIWGVHDRQLNLRQLLHEALTVSERRSAFYRRWRFFESKNNLNSELILSESEWTKEWNDILGLSTPTPRGNNENGTEQSYESLEIIHVYVLANVLKRPIIVVSDTILKNLNGEALSPIQFGGIYLPFEISPQQCHRSPLVLCYDSSHFSPLVTMKQVNSNYLQCVPIVDRNRNLLPLHFAVDPGPSFNWWKSAEDQKVASELDSLQTDDKHLELICKYMDVVKMDLRRGSVKKTVPMQNGYDLVPQKLLTLASGNEPNNNNGHASRIFTEIRQHFRWLSKRSKRNKHNRPLFSANELRQSNCLLTVLLHNFSHRYIDSMLDNYLSCAKERFEKSKVSSPSAITPKKNRISRSFSSSSVLLTCLNNHCNKTASPSTNFLCSMCFEDQKREMMSIGSSSTNASPNSLNSQKENDLTPTATNIKINPEYNRTECSKSSTMPALSQVNANTPTRVYYNGINHHNDEAAPIRYVDESTSASSTMSSRNGGRYIGSPPTALTRYFYEKDDEYDEPTIMANRAYRNNYDYDNTSPIAYSSSPPYRQHSNSYSLNNGRIQNPMFYTAPHSLPRVSLTSYRSHEYAQKPNQSSHNYSNPFNTPNVSCVKTNSSCSGVKNKVPSNGVSFYYAAS